MLGDKTIAERLENHNVLRTLLGQITASADAFCTKLIQHKGDLKFRGKQGIPDERFSITLVYKMIPHHTLFRQTREWVHMRK